MGARSERDASKAEKQAVLALHHAISLVDRWNKIKRTISSKNPEEIEMLAACGDDVADAYLVLTDAMEEAGMETIRLNENGYEYDRRRVRERYVEKWRAQAREDRIHARLLRRAARSRRRAAR